MSSNQSSQVIQNQNLDARFFASLGVGRGQEWEIPEDSMNRWLGFVCRAPAFLRGPRGAVLSVGLLALGAGACDSNVTAPVQFDPVRCTPAASLLVGINPQPFTLTDLHAAFLQAAGPIAGALGSSEQVDQIKQAMAELVLPDDAKAKDTTCRLLSVATSALAALPDNPETLPDRDSIRIVLILAAGVLAAGAR